MSALRPCPRSIQVGEFEVAISGGVWVAIRVWIDGHIGEPIGWQQIMAQSGLDFQTLQMLFFRYKSTTPMTWIRHRREAIQSKSA